MEHTDNIVLGAGKLFFDAFDADGKRTGERYLGDTPGFTTTINATTVDNWTSDSPVAERNLYITTQITRQAQIQANDISPENLALFILGETRTPSQTATEVADEAIDGVLPGRYYQLGVGDDSPTGVRSVSAVSLTDDSSTSYAEGSDYSVDLELGRLYILPAGGISQGANLKASYTPGAGSRDQVVSANAGSKYGSLRYIADNTSGTNRDLYAPRIQLTPNGDLAYKSRQDVQQMTFDAEFLKYGALEALYIDGRALTSP